MGLHTGLDLKKLSESELIKQFGKSGKFFYKIVRGIDDRPVQAHRETKSVGAEDTFPADLTTLEEMNYELEKIGEILYDRLQANGLKGKTITVKIKYHDFKLATRSMSFQRPLNDFETIVTSAKQLLQLSDADGKKVRLLGISLSNLGEASHRQRDDTPSDQLDLGI